MENISITMVITITVVAAIIIAALIVKLAKSKTLDADTLLTSFGDTAMKVINETLEILTMDIASYETEDKFREALTNEISENLYEALLASDVTLSKDNLDKLISTCLYLYRNDLKISQTYTKAKAAAEAKKNAVVEEVVGTTTTTTINDTNGSKVETTTKTDTTSNEVPKTEESVDTSAADAVKTDATTSDNKVEETTTATTSKVSNIIDKSEGPTVITEASKDEPNSFTGTTVAEAKVAAESTATSSTVNIDNATANFYDNKTE